MSATTRATTLPETTVTATRLPSDTSASDTALDPRYRIVSDADLAEASHDSLQVQMHTGMPGIIESYNAATMTVTVQPAIQAVQVQPDGTRKNVSIPLIKDVPVHFPTGGGHTMTFPIGKGDECWIAFSERNIDRWYQHGGVGAPLDWRMHDITDAVCFVGLRSQPGVLGSGGGAPAASATTMQLRSDDGKTLIDIDKANNAITLYAGSGGAGHEAVVFIDGKSQAVTVQAPNVTLGQAGGNIGLYGDAPGVPKGTITGSTQGNVALKNLLQFLQARGDLTDATT